MTEGFLKLDSDGNEDLTEPTTKPESTQEETTAEPDTTVQLQPDQEEETTLEPDTTVQLQPDKQEETTAEPDTTVQLQPDNQQETTPEPDTTVPLQPTPSPTPESIVPLEPPCEHLKEETCRGNGCIWDDGVDECKSNCNAFLIKVRCLESGTCAWHDGACHVMEDKDKDTGIIESSLASVAKLFDSLRPKVKAFFTGLGAKIKNFFGNLMNKGFLPKD
jgi:hypothetical protein